MTFDLTKAQILAMDHWLARADFEECTGIARHEITLINIFFSKLDVREGEAEEFMEEFLDRLDPPEGYDLDDPHDYKNWAHWQAEELRSNDRIYEFSDLNGNCYTIFDFEITKTFFWEDISIMRGQ